MPSIQTPHIIYLQDTPGSNTVQINVMFHYAIYKHDYEVTKLTTNTHCELSQLLGIEFV